MENHQNVLPTSSSTKVPNKKNGFAMVLGTLTLTTSVIAYLYLYLYTTKIGTEFSTNLDQEKNLGLQKKILLWNRPDRLEVAIFGTGHQPFIDQGCPVTNCYIEANSSEYMSKAVDNNFEILNSFDAILINIGAESWLSYLPENERPSGQRLVWLSQESPLYLKSLDPNKYDGLFNWTMTYKRDSDIQLLYGRVERIESQTSNVIRGNNRSKEVRRKSNRAALSKKSKTVAWMVSHCDTYGHREDYVRQLQEHIQVDVYGKCGNLSCPRNEEHWLSNPECYDMIEQKYKFYLSFENSICNDYVTEKFFLVLQKDVVPIVFGGADYQSIAPNHSYIDALAFSSPTELAEYLHLLDKNDELYLDYLEWKSDYRVEAGVEQMARHAFCDLCAKLNREDEPKKVYESMVPSWSDSTQCKPGWKSE